MKVLQYNKLLDGFKELDEFDEKIDLLMTYDVRTLTNVQIGKLLDSIKEEDYPKFVHTMNSKIKGREK